MIIAIRPPCETILREGLSYKPKFPLNIYGSFTEKFFFEKVRPSSLLKRFETPDEVANMVVFLCSPLASATNGAALRVDGGVLRSIV